MFATAFVAAGDRMRWTESARPRLLNRSCRDRGFRTADIGQDRTCCGYRRRLIESGDDSLDRQGGNNQIRIPGGVRNLLGEIVDQSLPLGGLEPIDGSPPTDDPPGEVSVSRGGGDRTAKQSDAKNANC